MTRFFPLRHIHNRQSRCKPRTGPKKVFPAGGGGGVVFFCFPPLSGALTGSQTHCEAIPHGQGL